LTIDDIVFGSNYIGQCLRYDTNCYLSIH